MNLTNSDKEIERLRYDRRASLASHSLEANLPLQAGSSSVPLPLRKPYIEYEKALSNLLPSGGVALELCSGMGEFSSLLVSQSKYFIATDISSASLSVLRSRFPEAQNMETVVCDIERLPFASQSFDLIACAGGLSYGDNMVVLGEVFRLLKPGGHFICVDSLDHNPVYRLNRTINYLRGRRTASTIMRMPTIPLIDSYRLKFGRVELQFFGAFTWLSPLIAKFIGEASTAELSDKIDRLLKVKMSAFKFVMVAQKTGFEAAEILS